MTEYPKFISIIEASHDAQEGWYLLQIAADFGGGPETVPFMVSPDDHGGLSDQVRDALDQWVSEGRPVGDYVPPEPEPDTPTVVDRRQILTALGILGWLTEEEAEASLVSGARPPSVDAVISSMPAEQQFAARMKWAGFRNAYIDDPLVLALAAYEGKSEQDVADLFELAAHIE